MVSYCLLSTLLSLLLFPLFFRVLHCISVYLLTTSQYVVIPERRSSAEALQILVIHLLGDAISPTVIGGVSVLKLAVVLQSLCTFWFTVVHVGIF